MSTGKRNIQATRITQLSHLQEGIFRSRDLANLWHIQDKNTLYTTLKRYQQSGIIQRIFKGLYAFGALSKMDAAYIGMKVVGNFGYVSTETVLYQSGFISQASNLITMVSSKSRSFTIGNHRYKVRRLQDKFLFNTIGIKIIDKILTASVERAIADMLYFEPTFHFDKNPDWRKIKKIQEAIGYPLTPKRYDFA